MKTSKRIEQQFAVRLEAGLLKRLRLESLDTGVAIREIVAAALDAHLPKSIRIVDDDERRASR